MEGGAASAPSLMKSRIETFVKAPSAPKIELKKPDLEPDMTFFEVADPLAPAADPGPFAHRSDIGADEIVRPYTGLLMPTREPAAPRTDIHYEEEPQPQAAKMFNINLSFNLAPRKKGFFERLGDARREERLERAERDRERGYDDDGGSIFGGGDDD